MLDPANRTYGDTTNWSTALEFICLDVLNGPLEGNGIYKVLTNLGITNVLDAIMLSFNEVEALPFTPAAKDANGNDIPTGGACTMIKKKFKAFISFCKFGCKFYNNFDIDTINQKFYDEF